MSSIFPSTPAAGEQVDGLFGEVYEWDGERWGLVTDGSQGPFLRLRGGVMRGPLILVGDGASPLEPVTLQQVEAGYLPLTGGIIYRPNISNPLTIDANQGRSAGISFHEHSNYIWSAGTFGDGRFVIYASSGGTWRMIIDFAGTHHINGAISCNGNVSAGDIHANSGNVTAAVDVHAGNAIYVGGLVVHNNGGWLYTPHSMQVGSDLQVNGSASVPWHSINAGGNVTAGNQLISGNWMSVQGAQVGFLWGDGWFGFNQSVRVWDLASQNNLNVPGTTWHNVMNANSGTIYGDMNIGNVYPTGHGNGAVGQNWWAWGGMASFAFINVSDPRLKDMLPTPGEALSKVKAIPVHRFTYTIDTPQVPLDEPHTGFDASEVLEVFPDAVGVDEEGAAATVALGDMIALLWQAVQELAARAKGTTNGH